MDVSWYSAESGGVVSFAGMSGYYAPMQITEERCADIEKISDDTFWSICKANIRKTLEGFEQNGITLPKQDYIFTILLSDPQNSMTAMTGDYCGDGGIPGYIIGSIVPNDNSLELLPVALAHEANNNVRWQFIQWNPSITFADMIVSEGLTAAVTPGGYALIQHYLKKTEKTIYEATITPTVEILSATEDFWFCKLVK